MLPMSPFSCCPYVMLFIFLHHCLPSPRSVLHLSSSGTLKTMLQTFNFVGGAPGSSSSPASLVGEVSPGLQLHNTANTSPAVTTAATSPLASIQHRLAWCNSLAATSTAYADKRKDRYGWVIDSHANHEFIDLLVHRQPIQLAQCHHYSSFTLFTSHDVIAIRPSSCSPSMKSSLFPLHLVHLARCHHYSSFTMFT